MRLDVIKYFHFTGLGCLLNASYNDSVLSRYYLNYKSSLLMLSTKKGWTRSATAC
jgi:hypothetical protein